MTRIKICGLMRAADIAAVNEAGPEYAGFVFADGRHHIETAKAAQLISLLSPSIRSVGVFVNEDVDTVVSIARTTKLSIIQLHGDETAEEARAIRAQTGCAIWKAVRVRDAKALEDYAGYPADRFLLDAFSYGVYGGTGSQFDWRLLNPLPTGEYILAGGIHAGNVCTAVNRYHPFALDISSGVETDGWKDPEKISEMVSLVRYLDARA